MRKFRLTPIAPEVWEICADDRRVGELYCSWSAGYDPHFNDPKDPKLPIEFWLWLTAHHQAPAGAYRWL